MSLASRGWSCALGKPVNCIPGVGTGDGRLNWTLAISQWTPNCDGDSFSLSGTDHTLSQGGAALYGKVTKCLVTQRGSSLQALTPSRDSPALGAL